MIFDLKYFLSAVVLLCLPLPSALSGGRSAKYNGQAQVPALSGLLRAWQNWFDLVRAAAGAYLLLEFSIQVEAPAPESLADALYVKAGIIAAGAVIQMLSFRQSINFFAPIFYLTSLTLVLTGYPVGVFAALFGWLLASLAQEPRFQLPGMATALLLGAFCFGEDHWLLWLVCSLAFLPQLLALICRREILFAARGKKSTSYRPAVALQRR